MELEITIAQYDLSKMVPCDAMRPLVDIQRKIKQAEEEEKRRREAEHKAQVKTLVENSSLIGTINHYLLNDKTFEIVIGTCSSNSFNDVWGSLTLGYNAEPWIKGVTAKELFDTVKELYQKAGYHIYYYEYSRPYWKDEQLKISIPA